MKYGLVWFEQHNGLILDRKSTRLNSSHLVISYAVFCLKKKSTPVHHENDGDARRPRDCLRARRSPPAPRSGPVRRGYPTAPRSSMKTTGMLVFFLNDPGPPEIYPSPPRRPSD